MLIYQSYANLDEKILFGKITLYLDQGIRKLLFKEFVLKENSTFHSGP